MENLKMQKHWYLAVIGLVGLWKLPLVWHSFSGQSRDYWDLLNLLWFLWFLHLVPETQDEADQ